MEEAEKTTRWQALKRDANAIAITLGVLGTMRRTGPGKPIEYNDGLAPFFASRADRPALIGETGRMTWAELDVYANRVAHWATSEVSFAGTSSACRWRTGRSTSRSGLGLSRVGVISALFNTNLTGERLAHCVREAGAAALDRRGELIGGSELCAPHIARRRVCSCRGAPASGDAASASARRRPRKTSTRYTPPRPPPGLGSPARRTARRRRALPDLHERDDGTSEGRADQPFEGDPGRRCVASGPEADGERPRLLLPSALSHGWGVMAVGAALTAGGAVVIARRFSAKRFWSDCAQNDVTSIQYIGELCRYLLNSPTHPDEKRHSIRTALGNGLRPEIWSDFQARFAIPKIVEFYGATEGNTALVNYDGRVGAVGHMPAILRKAAGVVIARFDVEQEAVVRDAAGRCRRGRLR